MKKILLLLMCIVPFSAIAQTEDTDPSGPPAAQAARPVVKLDPVTVEADRIEIKPRQTLDGRFIRSATGSAGDPLRVLNHLPSIGVLNDFVGVLSVRGGGPEDNLYYFDRLPLGYPYHLHGIVSTVNADVIENIKVYPGGYGAEFGADSQAVIDIRSRTQTDTRFGGTLNVNPVYSQAFLEGNIGERGYWYAFGRRSYMGPLFELLPRLFKIENDLVTEVPRFWSYQGKAVYQLDNTHLLVINAIGADDFGELNFTSDEVSGDLPGRLRSNNPFDSQGVHLYSEKQDVFTSIVSFTRSFSRTELKFGDGYFYRSAQSTYTLRNDLEYWVKHPKTLLESGFVLSSLPTSLISVGTRPPEEGDPDYDFRLKQDGKKVFTSIAESIHRLEGYLQARQNFASSRYADVYATVGIRANYFNLIDDFSLQPRGLLGVTLGPNFANAEHLHFLPVNLRFMYGSYVQNPRFYQVVLGKENPELTSSLARHYVVALEKNLTSKLRAADSSASTEQQTKIEIAGYYKDLRDMITYNISERRYRNQRTGYVKGVEVSLDHKIGDAFQSWLSYAYILSKRQDSPKDDERFYMYNTPHVVTIGLNYLLGALEFGANWQYRSGALYSPLLGREPYTNPFTKKKTWLPIHGDPARAAPYHSLNLRVHFSFLNIGKWEGGITAELWNAYNRTNILEVRYANNYTKEQPIAQLPIVPFLSVTLAF